MLNGHFENCYGLKQFNLPNINFSRCNKALIDLLILTHNFDFYRTVKLRLDVARNNCYIAQRDEEGIVSVTEFKYQKDFFKNVVIAGIKDGNITNDAKKKLLISSIPFYRNLCEYSGKDIEYSKFTCFLHLKTTPLDTLAVKIYTHLMV